jgi:hypothetical protein
LTATINCSSSVLMEVETLGVARSLGRKVHMRCANGHREEPRSMRRCVYRKQLDLERLVCARGPNFPLSRLESRLVDPGPHQCDDFCPLRIANDELFDLQSQIVIKRYRCAATRLPVYRINENINCLSFELFIFSLGTDTNMVSLCECLHW